MTFPVLYLSHGAPTLVDDTRWVDELKRLAVDLPRPRAILIVSAHWEQAPLTISSLVPHTPLTYDFWGFEDRFYQVKYDVPVDTAGGRTKAAGVVLDNIIIGGIVERHVPALVSPPGMLRTSLLGMSFLSRLQAFEFRGDRLLMRGGDR